MNELQMASSAEPTQAPANETYLADCLKCTSELAQYRFWHSQSGGCLNEHWSIQCPDCGFRDSDTARENQGESILAM